MTQAHAQKQRIWRENCKYALDENFHCQFCSRRKAVKFCHPDTVCSKWNLSWKYIPLFSTSARHGQIWGLAGGTARSFLKSLEVSVHKSCMWRACINLSKVSALRMSQSRPSFKTTSSATKRPDVWNLPDRSRSGASLRIGSDEVRFLLTVGMLFVSFA